MDIFDSHSAFNSWQVSTGNRVNKQINISGYLNSRKFGRNLKLTLSYSLRELIAEDINSQKNIRIINVNDIDTMIDLLTTVDEKKSQKFYKLKEENFFEAFRFLHRITFV